MSSYSADQHQMESSPGLDGNNEKPKKRLRMSVVCLNCKARKIKCDKKRPSCTNCIKCNVGHLCEYEPPHWVQRVTTSSGQPIVALKEAEAKAKAAAGTTAVTTSLPSPVNVGDTSLVHEEIKRLRAQLQVLEQSVGSGANPQTLTPQSIYDEDNQDTVDFYELYNSLAVKRSGMEEHKPLSSLAHFKKDLYFMIMAGYFNLCGSLSKAKYGDVKRRPGSKKTRLDASLTEFLYLLGERESPEVVEVVSKFIKERLPKNHSKNNFFPHMGDDKDKDSQEAVVKGAEKLIPPRRIVRLYLNRFYKYLYPYFPYIDKGFFDDRVFTMILASQDDDSPVTIVIEEKFDMVLLSMLLIILRITYIALPPLHCLHGDDKILPNYPMVSQCIAQSLSCLSLFKIMRKTKFTIVQALLLLRLYFSYGPEDGDGAELTQSQILFATIVQSAFTIGLNRDASRHAQMNFDQEYANLWRRVWLGILEVDKFGSSIAGHSPIIQNPNMYEMRFPELRDTDTKVDVALVDEYQRSQRILKLYFDLANMVNNFANAPKVSALNDVLRQMNIYININYSCHDMKPLSSVPDDEVDALNFTNAKRIMHTFQTKALTLAVYHTICLHYESKQNQNIMKQKEYQTLLLTSTVELGNLLYRFLTNGFNDRVDENHKFYINRYSENMLQRVINSFIGLLTRLYHSIDMIGRGIGSHALLQPLQMLIDYIFRISSGLNILMQNTLGTKYYQAFKTSLKYKFYLRSLRKDGYKCIRDTIQFLNQKYPDDPVARLSMLQRLDLKMAPGNVLQELDNMNCFVSCSAGELEHWKSIVAKSEILNDAVLSSDTIIWEPSFKSLPVEELRGTGPTAVATPFGSNGIYKHAGINVNSGGPTSETIITDSGVINLDDMLDVNGAVFGSYDDLLKYEQPENSDWLFRL